MPHHAKAVVVLALLAITAGCQAAATELSDADVTAVKAQADRYAKTAIAADWTAFGKELAADMVALPPNAPPIVGRDAFLKYVAAYPKITRFEVKHDEVAGRGDLAYARGTYDLSFTLPDNTPGGEKGTFLETHRKQADGTWLYTRLMWHSSSPPPAPAPAAKK